MGVSENSVSIVPNGFADHYPILSLLNGYFIGNINPTFSDKPIYLHSQMLHGAGIFTYIYPKNWPNVGKYW